MVQKVVGVGSSRCRQNPRLLIAQWSLHSAGPIKLWVLRGILGRGCLGVGIITEGVTLEGFRGLGVQSPCWLSYLPTLAA